MVCGLNLIIYLIFNIYPFTTDNLTKAVYTYQLEESKGNTLNIDYCTSGVGCTARSIFRSYKTPVTKYERTIFITPLKNNTSNRGSKDLIVLFCAYWRDIPKIRKLKVTNSLRVSCLFVSLSIPPKKRFDGQNGGNLK